jgi:hypothetical protein
MDRSKAILKLHGCYEIGEALKVGTILDGELVYNIDKQVNKTVFLVFDVLALDGEPLVSQAFERREDVLRRVVMNRCNVYVDNADRAWRANHQYQRPTMLIRKNYVDKSKVQLNTYILIQFQVLPNLSYSYCSISNIN